MRTERLGNKASNRGIVKAAFVILWLSSIFLICSAVRVPMEIDLGGMILGKGVGTRSGFSFGWSGFVPQTVSVQYNNYTSNSSDVEVRALAGQTIIIDYKLTVEKGSIMINVYGPRALFQYLRLWEDPLGGRVWQRTLRQNSSAAIAVPVARDGYYVVIIDPVRLTGSIDAVVDVR